MTIQETICKQIIETLSFRLNSKEKDGYPLYSLEDISSFIKSKIIQEYKQYYTAYSSAHYKTEQDKKWSDFDQFQKEIKGIQFYPKIYKSSNYITEICVVPNSQGRLNLAQSLHKDLNKYVTKTNLPISNIWNQSLSDLTVDYIEKENSVVSTNIELDLSVIDSINF